MIAWIAAWLALTCAAFAAAVPARAAAYAALAAVVAAACLRLPVLGAAAFALAAAAGLLALASVLPHLAGRPLRIAACSLVLPAVCAPAPQAFAAAPVWAAAAVALVLGAAAVAAVTAWALASRGRYALAAVVALAPVAPAGAGWLRWSGASAAVPHPSSSAHYLASGSFAVPLPSAPALLAWTWLWVPALLLIAVAVSFVHAQLPRQKRPPLLGAAIVAALLAAVAVLELRLAWSTRPAPFAHLPGASHPVALWPLAGQPWLDSSLVALLLARLVVLAVLLSPRDPDRSAPLLLRARTIAHVVFFAGGLALAAVWLAAASDAAGATWLSDPSAFALLSALLATAAAVPAAWEGRTPARDAAHLVQFAAAAVLLGGADAGWAVFGALLPLP